MQTVVADGTEFYEGFDSGGARVRIKQAGQSNPVAPNQYRKLVEYDGTQTLLGRNSGGHTVRINLGGNLLSSPGYLPVVASAAGCVYEGSLSGGQPVLIQNASFGVTGPNITTLVPSSTPSNAGATPIQVNGSGFTNTDVVNIDGFPWATTYVSASRLNVMLDTDGLAAGPHPVTVVQGGTTSNTVNLTLT